MPPKVMDESCTSFFQRIAVQTGLAKISSNLRGLAALPLCLAMSSAHKLIRSFALTHYQECLAYAAGTGNETHQTRNAADRDDSTSACACMDSTINEALSRHPI
ncbi:hypothetical protein AcW1_003656 [Taiwanofungus camphoratus]|nr:hypothetical protein AcV5_007345 [Antrodia cinnamomea]KAI0940468.1 hypothetical protein AcW1_003656 [Antrodia cinnamomea]KAI0958362.1 hypothetical protein AcV7_004199 [Antrodia cinnamomea]